MIDNKNKALTLEERRIIETGIRNASTKTAIARILGKDKSTIGKEIKLHRCLSYKCALKRECASYRKCKHGRECQEGRPDYSPFKCSRRDRSSGACNGCSSRSSCRFNKLPTMPPKRIMNTVPCSRMPEPGSTSPPQKQCRSLPSSSHSLKMGFPLIAS